MDSRYDDKTLRGAFAALAGDARPGDACPPPERLWAAIVGEIPVDERRALVDHIATCPSCAEDWRAARRMGARPPEWWRLFLRRLLAGAKSFFGTSQPMGWFVSRPGHPGVIQVERRWLISIVTIFALVLTLYVPISLFVAPPPPPPYRGIEAAIPADVPLSREDCRLRWMEQEGAVYDLTVTTDSLEPVVTVQGLREAQYLLREKDLAKVSANDRLLWLVEATLPSGQRITSRTFVSELK